MSVLPCGSHSLFLPVPDNTNFEIETQIRNMSEDRPGVVVRPNGITRTYKSHEVPAVHRREASLQESLTPGQKNNLRYQFEQMASDHVAPNPERPGPELPNPPNLRSCPVSAASASHSSGPATSENTFCANVEGRSSTARAPGRFMNFPGQDYNPNQSLDSAGPSGLFTLGFTSNPHNATPEQGYLPPGYQRGSSSTPCATCGGLNWRYSHQNACKVEM